MLGKVYGGGIDTAPIEVISLGKRTSGHITEMTIPAPYNDASKYALLNCFLRNKAEPQNWMFADTANSWQQLQVYRNSKVHLYFDQVGAYENWEVCITVARIR